MPLNKDPNKGGTNVDKSLSEKYCSFCYQDGEFIDGDISLQEKIERNVKIAVSMKMPEKEARQMAESILPTLERWRNA
jgi:hypothetical protein